MDIQGNIFGTPGYITTRILTMFSDLSLFGLARVAVSTLALVPLLHHLVLLLQYPHFQQHQPILKLSMVGMIPLAI